MGGLSAEQERLLEHFSQLSELRASRGASPIFALEHGLDESQRARLASAVREEVQLRRPAGRHWLPYVIYAAEIGYQYAGDEYWQTFASKTPGWIQHGDRGWLREQFQRFQRAFHGAQPSGPWARHFSIICWPITHAILPQDLQLQLAKLLFSIRGLFAAELFQSPKRLGDLIASRAWTTTRRFQQLAEEPLLLGQIAAALLLEGDEAESLILPATLTRISGDLEKTAAGSGNSGRSRSGNSVRSPSPPEDGSEGPSPASRRSGKRRG